MTPVDLAVAFAAGVVVGLLLAQLVNRDEHRDLEVTPE